MKKIASILFSILLILTLVACDNSSQNEKGDISIKKQNTDLETEHKDNDEKVSELQSEDNTVSENTVQSENRKILIAYFSVMETDGVDTVSSASRVVVDGNVLGNNLYIAKIIQQETGGDLFSIETEQEYPKTHDNLLEFAYEEKADNARPEISTHIDRLNDYGIVFLGYPNWNSDLPMPLYTFLEEYDFSGKTIIPFTTHGGSGFSRTVQTIAELQPNAIVMSDGLCISRDNVEDAEKEVVNWVNGLKLN